MAGAAGAPVRPGQPGQGPDESFRWTCANIVTVARIACIPALAAVMLADWADRDAKALVCLVVFTAVSLTDFLDGYLARSRNEVTTFGKFMDPIADKLLVMAALLALVQQGALSAWAPLVIVSRELLVSGLRMVAASCGVVIAASPIGKAKTFTTMVAIGLYIVDDAPALAWAEPWLHWLAVACMAAAVVLTVVSMVDYFARSWGLLFGGGRR